MGTTAADLLAYVQGNADDLAFATKCAAEASELVTQYVTGVTREIPDAILDRATLEVGSELFHRRQAPNGVAQFSSLDGAPVRVARDPMVGAYPLLSRYVVGFA